MACKKHAALKKAVKNDGKGGPGVMDQIKSIVKNKSEEIANRNQLKSAFNKSVERYQMKANPDLARSDGSFPKVNEDNMNSDYGKRMSESAKTFRKVYGPKVGQK